MVGRRIVFRKLHLWLSIPAGIFISLICLTGAILVFETEITTCLNSSLYYVEEQGTCKPMDELVNELSGQLEEGEVSSVQIWSDAERTYRFGISGKERLAVYVNPYTAKVVGDSKQQSTFFMSVRQLHRWLMLQDDSRMIGKRVVGITTLLMVVILISGIVLWMPKTKKQWKHSLRIRFTSGWKKCWYDLHCAGGMYAAMILLVLALTGLTWSFDWYRTGFYQILGAEAPQGRAPQGRNSQARPEKEPKAERSTVDFAKWQEVVHQLQLQEPHWETIQLQEEAATVTTSQLIGNKRASDRYAFDAKSGRITDVKRYKDQDKSSKIRGWIYSVHVGAWGGWFTKICTFMAALLGASLPITGYYFYIRKLSRKKQQRV